MTIENAAAPQDRGSLILGSILSVPLFIITFFAVMMLTYLVYTFLQGTADGIARIVELTAAVISSIAGVAAGKWVCDKAFKAWSGWPCFVILVLLTLLGVAALLMGASDDIWQSVLGILQIGAAAVAGWFMLIKGETFA